ncbi:MAG: hypothetical protein LBI30_03075 [Holosporales bacterium]|jgi:hypothetical protein|nr:hypothetical protein [Holosporales bacterium]
MHYSQVNISGELLTATKEDILRHAIALHGYVDPITGTKYDFFMRKIGELEVTNQGLMSVLREFF